MKTMKKRAPPQGNSSNAKPKSKAASAPEEDNFIDQNIKEAFETLKVMFRFFTGNNMSFLFRSVSIIFTLEAI